MIKGVICVTVATVFGSCSHDVSPATTSASPSSSAVGTTINPGGISEDDPPVTNTNEPTSELPSWIQPQSVRDVLTSELMEKVTVHSMSDAQLSAVGPKPSTEVFTPLNPSASFISDGQFLSIKTTADSFAAAWTAIAPTSASCGATFDAYWIKRPDWFTASLNDIETLRDCLDIASNAIATTSQVEEGLVVVSALIEWLPVAFSPRAELALRQKRSITSNIPDLESRISSLPLFSSYINSKPNIRDRLLTAPGDVPAIPSAVSGPHYGDYVDYEWSAAALAGDGGQSVSLGPWKSLFQQVDERVVFDFDSSKVAVNENIMSMLSLRMTHYRFGMGAARNAWLGTVGNLLGTLYNASPENVVACLPSAFDSSPPPDWAQLFYFLDDNLASMIPLYRCITDGIDSGAIGLATDDYQSLGTVLHMIRMTTSAIALVVTAPS